MRRSQGAPGHRPLWLVGLNEINIHFIRYYAARGLLPVFAHLLRRHGVTETVSESRHELLEPWIQWVTVHTGLPYAEHQVFRLGDIGDIGDRPLTQIWEHLERSYGCRVGAVSPLNAGNRAEAPVFFVPDPWTPTPVTGEPAVRRLAAAISVLVNENATGRGSAAAYLALCEAVLRWSPHGKGLVATLGRALSALRDRAQRAILLDELLADLFLALCRRHKPDFASLFLNGAAHLQHHYMLGSPACDAQVGNPSWYQKPDADPLLEAYRAYEGILARLLAADGGPRLLIATGLHQDPVERPVFYWRLQDPAAFLRAIGAPFRRVEGRMSRDFLVVLDADAAAEAAASALAACRDAAGTPLFEVDRRSDSLFVTLAWPGDIPEDLVIHHAGGVLSGFRRLVAFVALKNGRHNGIGYLIDTGAPAGGRIPLASLFDRMDRHFRDRVPTPVAA